jgi:PAS domain S-box-containing protein
MILREMNPTSNNPGSMTENKILSQNNDDYSIYSEDILRQKLHFEQTPLGVIEWDRNFKVIKWNPSAERIFGYSSDEAFGKSAAELILPDSVKQHVENIWSGLLSSKGGNRSTNENKRKDGKIILCDWYNTPLVNELGKVIGVSSLVDDITEREKSQKIQQALYQISESVHTIEDINQLYKEIHRIVGGLMKADNFYIALYDEKTEMISFPYFVDEFDSPPAPCKLGRGLTDYVLKTGKDMLVDAELDLKLRKQGVTDLIGPATEIWLGVTLKVKNKPIGVIVVQDYNDKTTFGEEEKQILTYVSEQIASAIRKKMDEDELKRYSEELKELNASKDKFFSIIAHDLRSPFHGLLGLTNILNYDQNNLSPEEVKNYLKEVHNSTSNLYSLIENLLDWARIQTGRLPFNPGAVNAYLIVEEVKEILQNFIKLKSINIKNELTKKTIVYADEDMIRSLLQNLLSNAIKFTNNGGSVRVYAEKINDDKLLFNVEDNGVGINEEVLTKLFKIDQNITTQGTNKEKGTGLGLLLCKEIVEKHNCEITVKSKQGEGSCFSFTMNLFDISKQKYL